MIPVWTKWIQPEEELRWESQLELCVPGRYVIGRRAGRERLRVEVYAEDEEEARSLQKEFGGKVKMLANDDWQGGPEEATLLKIRDRVLVTSESDGAALASLREAYPDRVVLSIPAE